MEEFKWDDTHQRAFNQIKKYLSSPPVIMPPRKKWPMKLYLSTTEESIGAMLAQENEAGSEQAIYYLSRVLTPVECRYTPIEKLCLALYFATMLALIEFNFAYVLQKAIKGRALVDFLADHPSPEIESQVFDELDSASIFMTPWTLMFDGSSTSEGSGAGIVIISPTGNQISFSFFLDFRYSNNQAEYEALIIDLEILLEMAVKDVHIVGDSSLVINQISKDFRCLNWQLRPFHSLATQLVNQFHNVTLEYRPKVMNKITNDLAHTASGIRVPSGMKERIMKITLRSLPSVETRNQVMQEVFATDAVELDDNDWRIPYILFLQHPTPEADRRIKRKFDYVLMDRDLYRRSANDGLLFQCISKFEGLKIMAEVHEGICGVHQAGIKMRWLIRRCGYYWPGMRKDCMTYAKGCIDYQKHGPMQWVPAMEMQLLVKPWPFRGWAMDLIGKINLPSSKGHHWIILATDYFTKWVEAEEYVSVTHNIVIQFLERHIFHRFGLLETIVADNGSVFRANEVLQIGIDIQVKMVTSTPYYAQGNGQAEASKKVVIEIIEKMIKDKPMRWLETLSEAL
ncbi:uncharacterized protein LOC132296016 [Cornus florida]|uniref:uncharacterized protein LOC132296016 n=1 Tax=Cornus florida TaxID=4283 RepID=UPI00289CE5A2|nr:uncharacterized protein LOC132296016 [Cornus florida]